ncbi:hypothetical protein CO613_11635 [Lysobacteraceae bacterium NML07-0707]|nr:hypothetical protein CO613_11635 [Xanthomonadaceae bacterium NML07-0707]
MWLGLLFIVPVKILFGMRGGYSDFLELVVYFYLILGNYVLGYRLMNPPNWSFKIIPKKWIDDWIYLSTSNSDLVKSNSVRLVAFVFGVVAFSIIILSVVNDKI